MAEKYISAIQIANNGTNDYYSIQDATARSNISTINNVLPTKLAKDDIITENTTGITITKNEDKIKIDLKQATSSEIGGVKIDGGNSPIAFDGSNILQIRNNSITENHLNASVKYQINPHIYVDNSPLIETERTITGLKTIIPDTRITIRFTNGLRLQGPFTNDILFYFKEDKEENPITIPVYLYDKDYDNLSRYNTAILALANDVLEFIIKEEENDNLYALLISPLRVRESQYAYAVGDDKSYISCDNIIGNFSNIENNFDQINNSINDKQNKIIYSNSLPKQIGTWIDNKPIYRLCIDQNSIPANANWFYFPADKSFKPINTCLQTGLAQEDIIYVKTSTANNYTTVQFDFPSEQLEPVYGYIDFVYNGTISDNSSDIIIGELPQINANS